MNSKRYFYEIYKDCMQSKEQSAETQESIGGSADEE